MNPKIGYHTCVTAQGMLEKSQHKKQSFELIADSVEVTFDYDFHTCM